MVSRTKSRKQLSQQDYYKDDPKAKELCGALEKNALDFGLHLFSLNDKRQGKRVVLPASVAIRVIQLPVSRNRARYRA